jgi:preprotein translocase subunit SecE
MLWVRVPPGVPFSFLVQSLSDHMFSKISSFLGEVKGELRKASWPWESDPKIKGLRKYKELVDSTIVVLIAMVLLAGFVQFWDFFHVLIVGFFTNFNFGG